MFSKVSFFSLVFATSTDSLSFLSPSLFLPLGAKEEAREREKKLALMARHRPPGNSSSNEDDDRAFHQPPVKRVKRFRHKSAAQAAKEVKIERRGACRRRLDVTAAFDVGCVSPAERWAAQHTSIRIHAISSLSSLSACDNRQRY